eukprot:365094-Chlamydomonas_euryale.AAC.1
MFSGPACCAGSTSSTQDPGGSSLAPSTASGRPQPSCQLCGVFMQRESQHAPCAAGGGAKKWGGGNALSTTEATEETGRQRHGKA